MQGTYLLFSTVKFSFKRSWKLTLWMCACVMRGHTGHKQSMAIARASKKASLINIFKEVFLIKLRLALYDNYSWTRCCWQTYLLKSLQNYRWAKSFRYFIEFLALRPLVGNCLHDNYSWTWWKTYLLKFLPNYISGFLANCFLYCKL